MGELKETTDKIGRGSKGMVGQRYASVQLRLQQILADLELSIDLY